ACPCPQAYPSCGVANRRWPANESEFLFLCVARADSGRKGIPMKLDVTDLSVRFGGLRALKNASVSVPDGTVLGLIGPNGAGKTTLFNAVSGFVKAETGTVTFGDRD